MTGRIRHWTVPSTAVRMRLDQYLAHLIFPDQSRSQIQSWIKQGCVRVNGVTVKTGYLIRQEDAISIDEPERPVPETPLPEELPLVLIHNDDDLAVIDKPAGMVCHLGAGVRSGTLVNALLYHFGSMETGDRTRPGIVHRLDKLTSGVMVVAKNAWTHRELARQFRSREVEKEYLALVYGRPTPMTGKIDLPIGRDPKDRKKISVRAARGRSAITRYQTLKRYGPFTLLKVRIETGRTHQIRVHLAHKGHPVVGDALYGGSRSRNLPAGLRQAVEEMPRFFLHSHRLEFCHPRTGRPLSFTAPLPGELEQFLAAI